MVLALAFYPDGEKLATGSMDAVVRLWGGRDVAPCEHAILELPF
jgi:WD40 repeat protein